MTQTQTRPLATAASAGTATHLTFPPSPRHRLRAVDRDEVSRVVDLLPPGATWLPAPQHTLPALPGQPPMVGYLVLVPADQQQPVAFAPQAVSAPPAPVTAAPSARASASASEGDTLVRIDPSQRTAEVDGRVLDLTYLEFELLAHLVKHPHRVHSRDQLVTTVWGYGHVGDGRTVDVHVARLRRKLGAAHRGAIQTVRRVGYKYAP
ncbi:winged helix-turn-helix domain-containing protein [Streptomyces sp. NPDC059193]|uniref:winged helix-turn-helix domain-containing protein n=1 Tax=Streptomyces sp. NPDC059193 TaxID=3346763 RepID=UPI0036911755